MAGLALHPLDMLDARSGRLLAAMTDPNVTTISPIVLPHPSRQLIASGSSRNIYIWEPDEDAEAMERGDVTEGAAGSGEPWDASALGGGSGGGAGGARREKFMPRMWDLEDDDKKKAKASGSTAAKGKGKKRGGDSDDD